MSILLRNLAEEASVVQMKSDIFLSCMREDILAVRQIRDRLCSKFSVWMDESVLSGGERWSPSIRSSIEGCRHFVPFFSQGYEARQTSYMRKEIEIAGLEAINRLDESFFIIPVALSGNRIPDIQLNSITKLSDLNQVNVEEDGELAIEKLISTMEAATLAGLRNDPTVEILNRERLRFRLSKFHHMWNIRKTDTHTIGCCTARGLALRAASEMWNYA